MFKNDTRIWDKENFTFPLEIQVSKRIVFTIERLSLAQNEMRIWRLYAMHVEDLHKFMAEPNKNYIPLY